MKKVVLSILIIISGLSSTGQTYPQYMQQGKSFFNKSDFMTALERFDLAYELSKTQAEKDDAKNWKNKSKEKIRAQQNELKKALDIAESEKTKAQKAYDELNDKTYSMRAARFDLNNTIVNLCDELLKKSSHDDSLMWLVYKAQSLCFMGDNSGAAKFASLALQLDSNFLLAQKIRIYYSHVTNNLDLAIKDTKAVYSKIPDFMNTSYMAFNSCFLGEYSEARKYTLEAINNYQFSLGQDAYQSNVPPEVEMLTNQKDIYLSGYEYYKSHYYLLLGIKAYAGEDDFEKTLNDLDTLKLSRTAYLYILSWTPQEKFRPQDYGVYAMQGAIWEKAGYPNYAISKYLKFRAIHKLKNERRYEKINLWVDKRIQSLKNTYTEEQLAIVNKTPGPKFLFLNANELLQKSALCNDNNLARKADSLIDLALVLNHQNIEYMLLKAQISIQLKDYQTAFKNCNKIIDIAPNTSMAYLFRAIANSWIDGNNYQAIVDDLTTALKYNPYYLDALLILSDLLYKNNPAEALSLLCKAKQIKPNDFYINSKIEDLRKKIK